MSESGEGAIPTDVEAMRQENERLKREIEKSAPERREKRLRLRRILVGILVVLTSLSLVVSTVGVWAHRTVFDTDTFVSTVGPVIEQPQVTARLANYLTDQIVVGLDLQQRATDVLTQIAPQAAFLAGPITNGIKGFVHDKILTFVRSDGFRTLWYGALRTAHDAAVKVLEGKRTELGFAAIKPDKNVVKISVIGVGMRSHAGVAKEMFRALAEKGINIQVISTSEIKVSVLVAEEYTELALRALHTAYGLDAD